jgi:hypothetical protein
MGASAASGLPHKKSATAKHRATIGAATRKSGAKGSRAKRSSRNAAAQEAARLGTAVGQACNGKASMQRDEHRWVVLCSNGKTYLIDVPQNPGAPAIECSLAGNGPHPGCFR